MLMKRERITIGGWLFPHCLICEAEDGASRLGVQMDRTASIALDRPWSGEILEASSVGLRLWVNDPEGRQKWARSSRLV